MNRYGSVVRRMVARNNGEIALPLPPADLTIPNSTWMSQFCRYKNPALVNDHLRMNVNSNVIIREAGLFANFADGLVLKTPANRFNMFITVGGYSQGTALTGTVASTIGSKTITGVGSLFTAELTPGGVIEDDLNNMYIVDSITNDLSAELTDYALITRPAGTWFPMSAGGSATFQTDITQLNAMFRQERFVSNALFSAVGAQQIGVRVSIQNQDAASNVDYLTTTIDPAFNGETVIFDSIVDLEFTYTP